MAENLFASNISLEKKSSDNKILYNFEDNNFSEKIPENIKNCNINYYYDNENLLEFNDSDYLVKSNKEFEYIKTVDQKKFDKLPCLTQELIKKYLGKNNLIKEKNKEMVMINFLNLDINTLISDDIDQNPIMDENEKEIGLVEYKDELPAYSYYESVDNYKIDIQINKEISDISEMLSRLNIESNKNRLNVKAYEKYESESESEDDSDDDDDDDSESESGSESESDSDSDSDSETKGAKSKPIVKKASNNSTNKSQISKDKDDKSDDEIDIFSYDLSEDED